MLDKPATDKPALAYLEWSGARAISVTIGSGGVVVNVGLVRDAAAILWTHADQARAVAARARKIAGDGADLDSTIAALQRAATECRAVLTDHHVAMARAGNAAARLDEVMGQLDAAGTLREFQKIYRARRLAAKARGEGFMSYTNAERRLRLALVPLLANGGKPEVGESLFRQVFGAR
jgi:hypothetical protein